MSIRYPEVEERLFDGLEGVYSYPEEAYGEKTGYETSRRVVLSCPCFATCHPYDGRFWRGEPCERHWCDGRGRLA